MAGRPQRPADSFRVGDRLWYKGRNYTVEDADYSASDRSEFRLRVIPDDGTMGERLIVKSADSLEEGDPLQASTKLWRRLRSKLP